MTTTVLIVDDEFGLAEISADLLAEDGFEVAIAINGKLALASLAARRADLVITDLMMPVMDGLELIRRMRAEPALAAIPIALMTALPEALSEPVAYDALLVKPFSMTELLDTARRLTGRHG